MEFLMVNWFIEKNNKIPFYLQLKELINHYISTGVLKNRQQLPGVNELARKLDINFDTVRKAYKELEKEGLVEMKRGTGTFVNYDNLPPPKERPGMQIDSEPMEEVKQQIRKFLQMGMTLPEVEVLMNRAFTLLSGEMGEKYLIFCECSEAQIREISDVLESYLKVKVKPVLLENLQAELNQMPAPNGALLGVVTTGFHRAEILSLLQGRAINLHIVITNMSPETRKKIFSMNSGASCGFICRDEKSIPFYTELLRYELGASFKLKTATLANDEKVGEIIGSSEVLLATPPVFPSVKELAPKKLPVFNVFDRVDPISLSMLRECLGLKFSAPGE